MNFAQEPYSETLTNEMMPLWQKHYDEIALYKDIPLSPDLRIYQGADERGSLRIFTARVDNNLLGYQIFFVNPNAHYKTSLQAVQDILFLDSSMRAGLNGYRFIRWCDEQLKTMGIQVVFQHVKKSHDFGPLLMRLGYMPHDTIYSRRLN